MVACSALALACGPGESGFVAAGTGGAVPGNGTSGTTGGLSIFVTDAPNPAFDSIWLTVSRVELLGPDGAVFVLFEGETIFDLLRLRSVSEMFSLRTGVPAGFYSKVRLQLDDVELVWHDARGNLQTAHPRLSGNGKLDLTPRGPFEVRAGQMLVLQIDVDGNNAIHIHQTGNGTFQFRPVVFVDVVDVAREDRLARVHGVVDAVDLANRTIDLCELNSPIVPYWSLVTEPVTVLSSGRETQQKKNKDRAKKEQKKRKRDGDDRDDDEDDDDDDGDDDRDENGRPGVAEIGMPDIDDCIELAVLPDAILFDEASGSIDFSDIRPGDSLLAVGHLRTRGESLQILTRVIVRAQPGGLVLFDGEVTAPPDSSGEFEVEARVSDLDRLERIDVQLIPETLILNRAGAEIGRDQLVPGRAVEVIGKPLSWSGNSKRQAEAFVIWVGAAPPPPDPGPGPGPDPGPGPGPGIPTEVSGLIGSTDASAAEFTVVTDTGPDCVSIDGSTRIDLFVCDSSGCVGTPADFGDLVVGRQVVAIGTRSADQCVAADDVVVFAVAL